MKILLLSIHPPEGGGSAFSSQELACGLRSLNHQVIHLSPYKDLTVARSNYTGLRWFKADFPSGLHITYEAQADIDRQIELTFHKEGSFDCVILGRESFLWHLPTIRKLHHSKPVILICRGAYINLLLENNPLDAPYGEKLIKLYQGCDRIICIARHLVDSLTNYAKVNTATFLPNPIHLPSFSAYTNFPLQEGQPIRLFMAAQLKQRKRPLDAVEIVRRLVNQKINVHLTICGDGVDREKLFDLIKVYNLEQHISLMGRVDREDILSYLNQIDIVLLCSQQEGRPRVLQEAIALGKGVVAYNNPGSREVVEEWAHKWPYARLTPIGDIEAASQAVLELTKMFQSVCEPPLPPKFAQPLEIVGQYEKFLQAVVEDFCLTNSLR